MSGDRKLKKEQSSNQEKEVKYGETTRKFGGECKRGQRYNFSKVEEYTKKTFSFLQTTKRYK